MVTQFQDLSPSLQHDLLWDLVQKCEVYIRVLSLSVSRDVSFTSTLGSTRQVTLVMGTSCK